MATINWEEIEKEMGGNHKSYVKDGDYTVKCDSIEIKEVGQNGSVIMKFGFEDINGQACPTADHWLTFKNANWRRWHNKCLMEVLGATTDAAKKAVEMAEKSDKKEDIVKGYGTRYKELLAKKPEVEIEVYTDDKGYARAEFKDRSVAMPHDTGDKKATKKEAESPLDGAEQIEEDDLPF